MRYTIIVCTALLSAAGCSTTSRYDARFGEAVRQARLAMLIHPSGSAADDPVAGMDGAAAHEALQRYQDSFKAPPPVINVINLGAAPAK